MAYRVELVQNPERFAALGKRWGSLTDAGTRPFDTYAWYCAWWGAFGGGAQLEVQTAWDGERLCALLPLVRDGRRLSAMANVHTPVFRPLATNEDALQAVVAAALESNPAVVELESLEAGEQVAVLRRELCSAGLMTLAEPQHVSPIVDTRGSFEDWRRESKPRWHAPLERFRRKMSRENAAEFSIVEAPRDLGAEIDAGFAVEASGWKGKAGTAVVAAAETEAFYRGVASNFHERGEVRLSRIVLDGRVAAFDLCLLSGGRLYLLKTGFDESFRRLAPGLVLRLSTIERCFELGLEAHELLGDDSEWKRKFATGDRAHERLFAFARGPSGAARYGYRSRLRPLLKRLARR